MGQRIIQVDAFTDRPFAGNPAAVCVLEQPADEGWMQAVAREMNLSETAFLHPEPRPDAPDSYRLRWFTPTVEVDLCGHATLAAAHVLWEDGHRPIGAPISFQTRSGRLSATRSGGLIALDFPAEPVAGCPPVAGLLEAIGESDRPAFRNRMDLLVLLQDEEEVRSLAPDPGLLRRIPTRGVIVTSRCERPGVDFVSRFFAPAAGVDEDPVTGSAHCALGPFWADRLGRSELVGEQVSARGGTVRVRVAGDRVELAGSAVTVLRGELC
ncbi:PhzF family phenazine biosynthesis protein [Tautonia sociabilis]|uniref:PhzF family phenazine biosynthesis protein n=1 Tax=Tautonia sociabilis TaxID=2080755 RepID=A0A432MRT6_9BACT|nr:PhzF family phenazine biosynthesis protein [Tautonia sociabilis]RUL89676.1 PhzF family phenazine biosynthesis protein [Tautonia sociabilis]